MFIFQKPENKNEIKIPANADIMELSDYNEEEVLFFPLNPFYVDDIQLKENNIYNITLKYLEENKITKKKIFKNNNTEIIPNTNYKKKLIETKLVNKEKINNISLNDLNKIYNNYIENKNKGCCSIKCKILSGISIKKICNILFCWLVL